MSLPFFTEPVFILSARLGFGQFRSAIISPSKLCETIYCLNMLFFKEYWRFKMIYSLLYKSMQQEWHSVSVNGNYTAQKWGKNGTAAKRRQEKASV